MPTLIAPAEPRGQRVTTTRGVLYIHACARALSPHVEWAVSQVLGSSVRLTWTPQPVAPGTIRAELSWQAPTGTGARLATALSGFSMLRFEVTEDPSAAAEGERFAVTPSLGLFRATIGVHGDILIGEDRLRSAMATAAETGTPLSEHLDALLGTAWDEELEPFRYAGDGAPIRYLHRVG